MKNGWNEKERLEALRGYQILDTPSEADFDDIVKIASHICDAPISMVSLIDEDRQWFKAKIGTDLQETPLDLSICSQAILQPGILEVPDASQDVRFQTNPLVKGDPHIRFYAGAVLETPEGLPLGALCVIDYKTRQLTQTQRDMLQALSRQVMAQLELRRSLREQKETENRLALAVDTAGFVGTWDWDIVRDRVFSDEHFARIFQIDTLHSTDGAPLHEYIKAIHPEDVAEVNSSIEAALRTGEQFTAEYRLVGRDGSVRWVHCRGRCLYDGDQAVRFPGVAVDITDRKKSELSLLQAENEFRQMTNALPQTLWTAGANGQLTYINDRGYEYFGDIPKKGGEIDWLSVVHPDDHQNSTAVWVESLTTGEPYQVEQRIFEKESRTFKWNLSRAMPIRDQQGKIVKWFGTNTDISEIKVIQDALREAQTALAQQNQILDQTVQLRTARLQETITELEAFSFSISHDMRSPLRAMQGYSDALLEDYAGKLDPEAVHYLRRIHKGATRLDLLIRDVLAYSKVARGEVAMKGLEMEALITDIVDNYPDLHPSRIEVRVASIPKVLAHEGLLTQVISNLLGNALKFARSGTFPSVNVFAETKDAEVKIFFADNGIGIDSQHHGQIFQIFGRVYPDKQFEGTGIGLAIVRKAVERMGGQCGVEATLGEGSRFWITLKKFI